MPAVPTGPSCGTAGSTPTATSPSGTWINQLEPPSALGFRMPAEWEPHRGTWLSWPHKEASWPGKFSPIPRIFARMVRLLADCGADTGNVFFHYHPTNDAWCRDHGPIFVQRSEENGQQAIIDWDFNAWGGKYPPFDLDDVIPTRIAEEFGIPVFHPGIVMEGGSIDVNGLGGLLTTEPCLLNPT